MSLEVFQPIHVGADDLIDILDPCEPGRGVGRGRSDAVGGHDR